MSPVVDKCSNCNKDIYSGGRLETGTICEDCGSLVCEDCTCLCDVCSRHHNVWLCPECVWSPEGIDMDLCSECSDNVALCDDCGGCAFYEDTLFCKKCDDKRLCEKCQRYCNVCESNEILCKGCSYRCNKCGMDVCDECLDVLHDGVCTVCEITESCGYEDGVNNGDFITSTDWKLCDNCGFGDWVTSTVNTVKNRVEYEWGWSYCNKCHKKFCFQCSDLIDDYLCNVCEITEATDGGYDGEKNNKEDRECEICGYRVHESFDGKICSKCDAYTCITCSLKCPGCSKIICKECGHGCNDDMCQRLFCDECKDEWILDDGCQSCRCTGCSKSLTEPKKRGEFTYVCSQCNIGYCEPCTKRWFPTDNGCAKCECVACGKDLRNDKKNECSCCGFVFCDECDFVHDGLCAICDITEAGAGAYEGVCDAFSETSILECEKCGIRVCDDCYHNGYIKDGFCVICDILEAGNEEYENNVMDTEIRPSPTRSRARTCSICDKLFNAFDFETYCKICDKDFCPSCRKKVIHDDVCALCEIINAE